MAASIHSGPRFDALRDAVRTAVTAFSAPLDDDDLEAGWTDEPRLGVLAALERLDGELAVDPSARLGDLDAVDDDVTFDDDKLAASIVAVDIAEDDLRVAEDVLDATEALLVALRSAIDPKDASGGFDESARDDLTATATAISAALARGAYLDHAISTSWEGVLESRGLRRKTADDPESRIFGFSPTGRAGDMESWPPGPRWEAVVLYDGQLQQLLRRDLSTEE